MRGKLNRVVPLLAICILWWGVGFSWSAPIHYKQTMTKILDETQFQGWPPDYGTFTRYFNMLTNSPDGSRIAFWVDCPVPGAAERRTYVANSDGSGLINLTGYFPPAVSPVWTATYYKLDDTGSRLFFRAPNAGNDINIYYFDLALTIPVCSLAVLPKAGETYAIRGYDARKPFSLTTIGGQTTLFFKHVGDWDPVLERYNQGIYSAPLGGSATKVMDINQLPGDENMNLLGFLGSAANTNRRLFVWNQDIVNPPGGAMWQTTGPARVPDELHDSSWDGQDLYTHIISANGGKALYQYTQKRRVMVWLA